MGRAKFSAVARRASTFFRVLALPMIPCETPGYFEVLFLFANFTRLTTVKQSRFSSQSSGIKLNVIPEDFVDKCVQT